MSMDAVFRALADRSRRRLLDRLPARTVQTPNERCKGLARSRQAVTTHLDLLEAPKPIAPENPGRAKPHSPSPVPTHDIAAPWLATAAPTRPSPASSPKRRLAAEK